MFSDIKHAELFFVPTQDPFKHVQLSPIEICKGFVRVSLAISSRCE